MQLLFGQVILSVESFVKLIDWPEPILILPINVVPSAFSKITSVAELAEIYTRVALPIVSLVGFSIMSPILYKPFLFSFFMEPSPATFLKTSDYTNHHSTCTYKQNQKIF